MTHPRDQVTAEFAIRFGRPAEVLVRSPGRVNLIGDHTDYNDGYVLPIATEQSLWVAAAGRVDRTVHLTSLDLGEGIFDLDRLEPTQTWVDYVAGTLQEIGVEIELGFDAVIQSEIPVGAGLSSSAALEVAVARLAVDLTGGDWKPVNAAQAAWRAENGFVGVPCGIMDQLIVATAVQGHATLLDCRTLDVTLRVIPDWIRIVILDTGTRRQLVDSAYEERRRLCSRAAEKLGVPSLRDVAPEDLETADLGPELEPIARHVVTENARTLKASEALEVGDLEEFGRQIDRSHTSLRDDFDVSSPVLNLITDLARNHPACFGARMTGAGFAGCGVALVDSDDLDVFIDEVTVSYRDASGKPGSLYPTMPVGGVTVL